MGSTTCLPPRATFDREVLDSADEALDVFDDEAFDAAYEIHGAAEAAALFVVCDLAEALAGAHSRRTNINDDEIPTVEAGRPAASGDVQQSRMVARVADFHPWIATRAEPLFADGHYQAAIVAALQTLEAEWRSLLGVDGLSLGELARMSFDRRGPHRQRTEIADSRLRPRGLRGLEERARRCPTLRDRLREADPEPSHPPPSGRRARCDVNA